MNLNTDVTDENVAVLDDAVADSSGLTGASEIQMPTAEQLGISVISGVVGENGNPLPLSVTVGDTFDFPVTVSWSVNGSALLVVPVSSVATKGLEQVGVSQESARAVKDGKEMASITFTYKIVAQDTGDLNIPVMRFEIPTPMGQALDLRSESVPVRVNEPASVLPFAVGTVVALCVVAAGLWRIKRRAKARAAAAARDAAESELRERMLVLKRRAATADSREWLLELEQVCKMYAAGKFNMAVAQVNLESLLKEGRLEGWEALLEEFAHARYGGGKRDAFENKETWKAAMKLMGVEEIAC
ncbi:MAG: hypothetical protein HUK19_01190 [Fibrobacter sp.]|nr:hypothetical protein [Fibrobacter sp.]